MIKADPQIAIAVIWERLADQHGTTIRLPDPAHIRHQPPCQYENTWQ